MVAEAQQLETVETRLQVEGMEDEWALQEELEEDEQAELPESRRRPSPGKKKGGAEQEESEKRGGEVEGGGKRGMSAEEEEWETAEEWQKEKPGTLSAVASARVHGRAEQRCGG